MDVDKYSASRPPTCRRPRFLAYVPSRNTPFPLAARTHFLKHDNTFDCLLLQIATLSKREGNEGMGK